MVDRQQHLKQVAELRKTFVDPCDGLIYHYTSVEGFKGIIETSELWLTNTEFVNDTTECNTLQKEKNLFGKEELSFNRYLIKQWEIFSKKRNESLNYYIVSFSKVHDLLEQWRSYGNICIGFDAKQLKRRGFYLYECVYNKEEIKKWILEKAKAKEWSLDEPDRSKDFMEGDIKIHQMLDGRTLAASELLFIASIKLKNDCYHNEKEVRLLAISSHDWKYEKSPSMYEEDPTIHFRMHPALKVLVPYVKFFIFAEAVEEVKMTKNYNDKTEFQIKVE